MTLRKTHDSPDRSSALGIFYPQAAARRARRTQRNRPCRSSTQVSSSACDPRVMLGLKREAPLRVRSRASTSWSPRTFALPRTRSPEITEGLANRAPCTKLFEAIRHHSRALRCANGQRVTVLRVRIRIFVSNYFQESPIMVASAPGAYEGPASSTIPKRMNLAPRHRAGPRGPNAHRAADLIRTRRVSSLRVACGRDARRRNGLPLAARNSRERPLFSISTNAFGSQAAGPKLSATGHERSVNVL